MSRSSRILAFVIVTWTAASPFLWQYMISESIGAPIPWQVMAQPAALAAIGLLALPGFWLGVRWVAWSVIVAAVVVVLSQVEFPSATPAGTLMNGALLCVASVQGLRSSLQHRRLPS